MKPQEFDAVFRATLALNGAVFRLEAARGLHPIDGVSVDLREHDLAEAERRVRDALALLKALTCRSSTYVVPAIPSAPAIGELPPCPAPIAMAPAAVA